MAQSETMARVAKLWVSTRKWAPWIAYWLAVPLLLFELVVRFGVPFYGDNRVYFPVLTDKVVCCRLFRPEGSRLPDGARLVGGRTVYDRHYYWKTHRNWTDTVTDRYFTYTARTNSLGFRGTDPAPKKPGEYRVMLIGDSATYGVGLNEVDTISEQIERFSEEKQGKASNVLAYNFGHPAFNLIQELILLRDYFDAVKPDHVILILSVYTDNLQDVVGGVNPEGSFTIVPEKAIELQNEISSYYGPLNWSMLFRMFQFKFLDRRIYYSLSSRAEIAQKSFELIDSFTEECRARGAAFTAVNVYSPNTVRGGLFEAWNGSRRVHEMYTRYCRNHQIDIIDMSEFINGYDDWKKYYFGEGHPNVPGARKIAEAIYDRALAGRLETGAQSSVSSR
jgi:hypothetical protein